MMQELIEDITPYQLQEIIAKHQAKRIFLVTGKSSYTTTGAAQFIESAKAEDSGLSFIHFDDFEVNPKVEDVLKGVALFKANKCDFVIAIGGGSVMDMAKCINSAQAHQDIDCVKFIKENAVEKKGVVLMAIPTTAGSGSEATHFAVVYIGNEKFSLANKFLLPDIVGLNYHFTCSQSVYLTACAGLDALSQAIESYWSVGSNEVSMGYADLAISLLIQGIRQSVLSPTEQSRKSVSKGAHYSGKAINISKTTGAHAISYAFTKHYGIPHGHAVFLSLPHFFVFNSAVTEKDLNDVRGANYVRSKLAKLSHLVCGHNDPERASKFLLELCEDIGVELSLSRLGIRNYEDIIVESVNIQRLKNNPRNITSEQILELFIA